MGHNFFFVYGVVIGMQVPWPIALGAVAVAGFIFILTAGVGLRERLITAIPDSLKRAIAVGIGLLIAFVGLQWAGIVVAHPGTLVALGNLHRGPVLLSLFGFAVMAALLAARVKGALLAGMLLTTVVGLASGLVATYGPGHVGNSLGCFFTERLEHRVDPEGVASGEIRRLDWAPPRTAELAQSQLTLTSGHGKLVVWELKG